MLVGRGCRGWRTKVNNVGDIGGNIGGELDSIVDGAIFLKLFPRTPRKLISFKPGKRIQVLCQIIKKVKRN